MEMTKATIITWGSEAEQFNEAITVARTTKLSEMADLEKTDPALIEVIDEVTTKRFWKDQAAAEEFITFIKEQAEINGGSIVSAVIEDYINPV